MTEKKILSGKIKKWKFPICVVYRISAVWTESLSVAKIVSEWHVSVKCEHLNLKRSNQISLEINYFTQ